jgi:acetyl esterase/lipase
MLPGACIRFNRAFGLAGCHTDPRSPESSLLGAPVATIPAKTKQANPIAYVSKHYPPTLIVQGERDGLVPVDQSDRLFAALDAAGVPATYYLVPDAGHDKRIVSPSNAPSIVRRTATAGPAGARPTLATIEAFLRHSL